MGGTLRKLLGMADWKKARIGVYEKRTDDRILEFLGTGSASRQEIIVSLEGVGVPYSTVYNTIVRMVKAGVLQELADGAVRATVPVKVSAKGVALRLGLVGTGLGGVLMGLLEGSETVFLTATVMTLMVCVFLAVSLTE